MATNEPQDAHDDDAGFGRHRKLALSDPPRPARADDDAEDDAVATVTPKRARRRPRVEHVSTPPQMAEVEADEEDGRVTAPERASAKKKAAKKAPKKKAPTASRLHSLPYEITGVVLFALDVLLALSLISYSAQDHLPGHAVGNWIGPGGAFVADVLTLAIGMAAFALPLAILVVVVACFRPVEKPGHAALRSFCAVVAGLSFMALLHLVLRGSQLLPFPAGGLLGAWIADAGSRVLAPLGTGVVAVAAFFVGVVVAVDRPLGGTARSLIDRLVDAWHSATEHLAVWREERRLIALEAARGVSLEPVPSAVDLAAERRREREEKLNERRLRIADKAQTRAQERIDAAQAQREPSADEPVVVGAVTPLKSPGAPAVAPVVAPVAAPVAAAVVAPVVAAVVDAAPTTVEEVDPRTLQSDPPWTKDLDEGVVLSLAEAMAKTKRAKKAPAAEPALPSILIDDGELKIIERDINDAATLVAEAEKEEIQELKQELTATTKREHVLPPLHLLDYDAPVLAPIDELLLRTQAEKLIAKFMDFGIEGRIREIRPGPVVTTYEFIPAPGIKVSKVAALSDDIAMAMEAVHVRIVAPIPGKGAIGIEIPNEKRETVYMKEIIADPAFKKKDDKLLMALGKDIEGKSYYSNLADMPHVLIAGTTGSGKSVSVNAMICSILYRATPEDVRFMMIDPKMIELQLYEGIPHLLLPPIVDSKKAAVALKWAVAEMERRYQLLSDVGVRDIKGFNDRVAAGGVSENGAVTVKLRDRDGKELTKLPFIVIVIDEYADLLAVAGKDVEAYVMRLAQKARAAGMHVMLATQRPSVDVITGVIKANFPVRMGFRLASNHDSKTIINQPGAEKLLGRGDMLFMPPGTNNVVRVHGAFISEKELHRVVDFLKAQGKPDYDMNILTYQEEGDGEGGGGEDPVNEVKDARWEEALALVARTKKCSTSYVQRMLNIGYQRSARIVDRMEREGLVGPALNTKGDREIYLRPDDPRLGGGGMNAAFKDDA